MKNAPKCVAVIGAGAWGSALSMKLAENGCDVRLWGRSAELISSIKSERLNTRYLPGCLIPENISVHSNLQDALDGVSGILIATPSSTFKSILIDIANVSEQRRILWACKGFTSNGRLLSDVAADLGFECSLISGPNFAKEVAERLPAAAVVASNVDSHARFWQQLLNTPYFRCYRSEDLVGIQICGGCKNIIAIAAGISDGKGFGSNARSALITRGLNEMRQLGAFLGAQDRTFLGLAGVGDLILTAADDQSRNRRYGLMLGRGEKREKNFLVEGMTAASIVALMSEENNLDLPICKTVNEIIHNDLDIQLAFEALMVRPIGNEFAIGALQ